MKTMSIENYLTTDDTSIMENCLIELPPFGSFPMRAFRRKFCDDFLLDAAQVEREAHSDSLKQKPANHIAA
jgi:hypothetical protein